MRLIWSLSLCVVLASAGVAACGPVEAPELASAETPIDVDQARGIADDVARDEIARVEAEHRAGDPLVALPFDGYDVDVTERDDGWSFLYQFTRTDVPFMRWLGHGMHFSVRVDRTGATQMIGGE